MKHEENSVAKDSAVVLQSAISSKTACHQATCELNNVYKKLRIKYIPHTEKVYNERQRMKKCRQKL